MTKVKRFDAAIVEEESEGGFVLFSDYEKVKNYLLWLLPLVGDFESKGGLPILEKLERMRCKLRVRRKLHGSTYEECCAKLQEIREFVK